MPEPRSLDEIADGERDPKPWLRALYFGDPTAPSTDPLAREGLHATIDKGWEDIDARAVSSVTIGKDEAGHDIAVRVGRYGPYVQIGDGDERASLPESIAPDEVTVEDAMRLLHEERVDARVGQDLVGGKPDVHGWHPDGPLGDARSATVAKRVPRLDVLDPSRVLLIPKEEDGVCALERRRTAPLGHLHVVDAVVHGHYRALACPQVLHDGVPVVSARQDA